MTIPQDHSARRKRRWLRSALVVLVLFLLAALVPPWITVGRARRRIAASISGSLGRPVHLDNVSLRLLPRPGFILENFVVSEDPAFGSEPVMRANSVTALVRIRSLWRGQIEISNISLDEPSVNLVRNAQGQWNIQQILLQASHVPTAPTAQKQAGSLPRFPYIQATNARLNLKMGAEKLPYSLLDAEFALSQPQPGQWRVHLEARPVRTDMNVSDAGTLLLDATLSRATSLSEIPLDLHARWRQAQFGELSNLFLGRDIGWRGVMDASVDARGVLGDLELQTYLRGAELRRMDFIPQHTLTLEAICSAHLRDLAYTLDALHCTLPLGSSDVGPGSVALTGSITSLRTRPQPVLQLAVNHVPAAMLLDIARHQNNTIAPELSVDGVVEGAAEYNWPEGDAALPNAAWRGSVSASALIVRVPGITGPLKLNVTLAPPSETRRREIQRAPVFPHPDLFELEPVKLALDGRQEATLDGRFLREGFALYLNGEAVPARVLALGNAFPFLGHGLVDVIGEKALKESSPDYSIAKPYTMSLWAWRPWGESPQWGAAIETGVKKSKKR